MAQIIPPITSLPIDSGAAPSVEDIQDRLPSICVDYLSHNWTEEDVWASWRNMTRHKHEIANGVRLENASWRTWNKQRNKLRTISPETLNWLKDSDVTWLYGPLHTANVEPVRPLRIAGADERYGIDTPSGLKPGILKHRTLSELLSIPGPTSPDLDATIPEDDDENQSRRPSLAHNMSMPNLAAGSGLQRNNTVPSRRPPPSLSHNKEKSKERSPESHKDSGKRHISFNTFVEQVIALDEPQLSSQHDDDSDDDMLEMRSSLSRFSSNHSRGSSVTSVSASSMTIAKIPPTTLKTTGSFNNPSLPILIYQPTAEYMSPQAEQAPVRATSPFDIPSPHVTTTSKLYATGSEEDEYSGIGMDYFGGPDLTGTSPGRPGGNQFGRPPAVQAPPAQPKWRQSVSASDASPSNSSSSSSLNGVLSPQPGRSILKVRATESTSPIPEPVSPPAIFNYNPSVATGIGGMFGSYEGAAQAGLPIGSPPIDERGREARGRSTSRGHGSSQYDRSVSRGTSSSTTSSIAGSVARSPVEAAGTAKNRPPTAQAQQPQLQRVQDGANWEASQVEAMDVDYSPERSTTPTPHSSPQIVFRPLKDTSPASLPHNSTRRPKGPGLEPELPLSDSPTGVSGPSATGQSAAAVTHTSVNAEPTLSQSVEQPGDDDDGSTLIGRATNIANTAKDLLGALWYGAQDESGRPRTQTSTRRHHRGASLG